MTAAGCGRQLLSVVLDVPQSDQKQVRLVPPEGRSIRPPSSLFFRRDDSVRPPIERTLNPDSAVALLPRDHAGNVDWVAALRKGVVRPRNWLPGDTLADPTAAHTFGFDFYFPGPAPTFDAYFPHSAHTEWLACAQCHPRIFPYRGTEIKMANVLQGQYCGECHGKVAFPPVTACERCHVSLPQAANRAQPELLGTFRFERSSEKREMDTATVGDLVVDARSLPEAVFPHWVHRIRFKCKVCHMQIFEPKRGANKITMKAIGEGEFCGKCHNGVVAFAAGFNECQRCHQPQPMATN